MNNKMDSQEYKNYISYQVNNWKLNKHISSQTIQVLDIVEQDLVNNGNGSTFNIMLGISCSFKCCKENPSICQNSQLAKQNPIQIDLDKVIDKYNKQFISNSITFQGLEVLDNLNELLNFINVFRITNNDFIYIWTGYTKDECESLIDLIKDIGWKNIIIKFGRYIPNQKKHYDEVLGVYLASDNQYAERIS